MAEIVLVAAGGLARETIAAVRAAGDDRVVALLDDDPSSWGSEVGGLPVVGPVESAVTWGGDTTFVVCAGRGTVRERLVARLSAVGIERERFAAVFHPAASVADGCLVGAGSILLANVVLTADVVVGEHVVAMPGAVLTHDDVLHDFTTVCAGVVLGGGVVVGERAYLGMAASVRQGLTIGRDAVLGMGAVLLQDLPPGETWAGAPARALDTARSTRRPL
ncbi:NeuD/PglB/VioB family sugar acetyltransferase [Luteimicrobium subarcticum]|uniref:Sugar O-acyltransferase (Sialic acid O-acetyltransferase NeuD family) n=1 Tax=Luteimicrobium subarcticum TaxID=620910 RepID=A0A2M8WT48_9MICO|nr:NeuD/PglB/VioB family sugar acetyltransferase [Luteimicrobium subarcticum]PJI94103.1 sugar O-acyltransferase (sialic acid O-acetyltransferase NeuD family) [Luteimicrobium subarcticum]